MSIPADVRHTIRHLRQAPGFTLATVLTFAVAIGSNSAIFSAVNTVLLRPLPVRTPEQLAVVWQTDGGGQAVVELTHRHWREWMQSGSTFTHAALMGSHNWSAVLEGRGEPARVWFNGVSGTFFDTLGVAPLLGRALRADDDVPNGPAVAVLNHGAWARRFGSDPGVVGSRIMLDGTAVEIVGVMPPGVDVPRGAELWVPVVPLLASGTPPDTKALDTLGVFYVVGRVRPGLAMSRVRAEVDATEARLDADNRGRLKWGTAAVVTPFVDYVFGPVRPALQVLWAAVVVLLLIACANVSGLLLTRVARKRHELSVRLALGAGRLAIARLWLTETLVVALAGGALGLVIAHWLARGITALAPDDLPRVAGIAVDAPIALFTLGIVVVVAMISAAVPLVHAGKTTAATATLDASRATESLSALRARSTLLVVQIGLSIVLMVGAGLVLRSFQALTKADLGFLPADVVSASVQPRTLSEPPNEWIDRFLRRVRAVPGVEAAGAVYLRPLMLGPIGQGVRVRLEGQPENGDAAKANPTLNHQIASSGYFETMKISLKAGRVFDERDTKEAVRVAIVSESTAQRLWPGQSAVGKRMWMASFTPGGPAQMWRTIVGVVADVRYRGLQEVQLDVYDAALQTGRAADNVVVRSSIDPAGIASAIRSIARDLDATAIVDAVTTLDAVVARAEAPWRLTMWMFVLFAGLAFGLSALGLFALVALDVAQRQREFAVRSAFGASHTAIVRGVLVRAAWRVAAGAALGVVVALVAGRSLRVVLYGVAPADAWTYGVALALLFFAAAIAAFLPAWRVGKIQPQTLLRRE
jgi:putative ABC transport system permease protein